MEYYARDGILRMNKQTLAGVLAGVTVVWFLSARLGYYLLADICHALIVGTTIMFVRCKISAFINKLFALAMIYDDPPGRDLIKFLLVVACLSFLSVAGSWANFLTLFYFVLHVFRKITKAVISSPGFNDSVNNLCGYILDRATASILEPEAAMFMPGARRVVLNALKMLGKHGLILLLVGIGENYNDAKAFVGLYVTETV